MLKKPSISIPNAAKMPKVKSLPKATDKPSVFFKKEEFGGIKHPSIEKLRTFLEKHRAKKQS
jgi:hypothetical protein